MNKVLFGLALGIMLGIAFTAYVAGKDWDEKVAAKSFTWRDATYQITEVTE